jgi:succinoglycan biosynthesis protein ExoA
MQKVTLIFPIKNEKRYVYRSLGAILAQDYPAEQMEVMVADGMSTDQTRQVIHDLVDQHPHHSVSILDNPGQIVPTGMNIALRQAKGDIIIRVDGHTLIAPDYVRQCVEALRRTNADNVGGKMSAVGQTHFEKAVAMATSTPFGVGGARFHYSDQEEWVDTVYMGAWPRRIFEKIGLFDEELVRDQDDEFNYRLREAGGRIVLCPQIRSEYTVRSSLSGLWRQYFQYGFWKVRVLQKHPRQMSLRQFAPPALVLALLGSAFLAAFPDLRSLSLIVPLLYLFVNLLASLWTASKRGWKSLPFLPLTFAILHLGYGSGFLVGLFRFAGRWGDKQGKTPAFASSDA